MKSLDLPIKMVQPNLDLREPFPIRTKGVVQFFDLLPDLAKLTSDHRKFGT